MKLTYIALRFLFISLLTLGFQFSFAQDFDHFTTDFTENKAIELTLRTADGAVAPHNGMTEWSLNGEKIKLNFQNGQTVIPTKADGKNAAWKGPLVYLKSAKKNSGKLYRYNEKSNKLSNIPLWTSILPPLIAIILALIFREVLVSLFAGIWAGAFILNGFSLRGFFSSLYTVIDTYIVNALADKDHLSVIVFSMLIGGMVAIVSRNGGMRGIVNALSVYAKNARSTQLVTWFMGIAIFFDDYANTLIVGNTMRPVTDKFRISREKLAYIVDSTAAPIAAIAFVTTWIGAELGYIEEALKVINLSATPYSVFLNSLAYSFYPIFTLFFVLFLIIQNKDFGTMFTAEHRARTTGKLYDDNESNDKESAGNESESEVDDSLKELEPVNPNKLYWYNALIPVAIVVIGTLIGLCYTGYSAEEWAKGTSFFSKVSQMIGNSNSYAALLWSSLSSVIVAIMLTVGGRIMSLKETMETMADGFKTMLPAVLILVLAWALGKITQDLYTADFLTSLLDGFLSPRWIPSITFILAGLIAFSTGSSWSTMAILYPLMLPATWNVATSAGMTPDQIMPIFYSVTACVLAGSVFGDHCSPISDTTILSSMASGCGHLDHVKTQLPYALFVGILSITFGILSAFISIPGIIWFIAGIVIMWFVIKLLGKPIPPVSEIES